MPGGLPWLQVAISFERSEGKAVAEVQMGDTRSVSQSVGRQHLRVRLRPRRS